MRLERDQSYVILEGMHCHFCRHQYKRYFDHQHANDLQTPENTPYFVTSLILVCAHILLPLYLTVPTHLVITVQKTFLPVSIWSTKAQATRLNLPSQARKHGNSKDLPILNQPCHARGAPEGSPAHLCSSIHRRRRITGTAHGYSK